MSIQSLAWAIEQDIPGEAKLVLMALANHTDHTSGECRFDAPIISRESSVGEPGLPRYLGALRRNGYLVRSESKDGRRYWLQFDREGGPWSWDAEGDEAAAPSERRTSLIGASTPSTFQPAQQAEQRERVEADRIDRAVEGFPVIEGSRAHKEWVQHCLKHNKIVPFAISMIVNGKTVRGFRMPSLFPPAEEVSAA